MSREARLRVAVAVVAVVAAVIAVAVVGTILVSMRKQRLSKRFCILRGLSLQAHSATRRAGHVPLDLNIHVLKLSPAHDTRQRVGDSMTHP